MTLSIASLGCAAHGHAPPPHFPDGGAETASAARAAPSHPAPATPAPDSSTNLHAAACAVLCGGTPRVYPHPLWSWRASESRAARQHGTHTARSSSVAACCPERAFLAARPPSCTAHPVAHTSPETQAPTGVAASCRSARTRTWFEPLLPTMRRSCADRFRCPLPPQRSRAKRSKAQL